MQIKADSVDQYFEQLPEDRRAAMAKLRKTILNNIPEGFSETISYGMIGYVVPHSLYAPGYHCDPKLPLPFMTIGSQKNFIVLHHLGIYADENLLNWFTEEYPKHTKANLDMGKGCVRFKKPELIPYELIAQLAGQMTISDWISRYESAFKRR